MLILKHLLDWSYDDLEQEVRANLVYRAFTRSVGCSPTAGTAGGRRSRRGVGAERTRQQRQR